MQGNLELLKITGYLDDECKKPIEGKSYTVMINPESINCQQFSDLAEQPNLDVQSKRDKIILCDELSFNLIIDCTGIVDSKRTNMEDEINALQNALLTFNGAFHYSNFVKIQWGENNTFKSKLKSFDTAYTLFKPDGNPLRAKITLIFGN